MKNSKSKEDLGDLIEKKCDNCSFWYNGYCTFYKQATFRSGLCENHHLTTLLQTK